ncbi:MAG: YkoF family thiamine/hydroxymethylpyrimidine-binding protein [Chloroflexota bacterium]
MFLAAQVSIYPLRQAHFSPAIGKALDIFRERGLTVEMGAMSSVVSGEDEALFPALKEVFQGLAEKGELVMLVTFSNACPVGK